MNESKFLFRAKQFTGSLLAAAIVVAGVASPLPVVAAEDPCVNLNKLMASRVQVIQHIQSYKDKKPTAEEACGTFTQLAKLNATSIAAIERDGAWCRAPDGLADNFKAQQVQIDAGKTNACKAAVEQKKAAANGGAAQRAPLGGTGDILGGPMKLPQGAL
jgi:hypothetical protein